MIPMRNLKRQYRTLKTAIYAVVEETLPTCQKLNEQQIDREAAAVTAAGE